MAQDCKDLHIGDGKAGVIQAGVGLGNHKAIDVRGAVFHHEVGVREVFRRFRRYDVRRNIKRQGAQIDTADTERLQFGFPPDRPGPRCRRQWPARRRRDLIVISAVPSALLSNSSTGLAAGPWVL